MFLSVYRGRNRMVTINSSLCTLAAMLLVYFVPLGASGDMTTTNRMQKSFERHEKNLQRLQKKNFDKSMDSRDYNTNRSRELGEFIVRHHKAAQQQYTYESIELLLKMLKSLNDQKLLTTAEYNTERITALNQLVSSFREKQPKEVVKLSEMVQKLYDQKLITLTEYNSNRANTEGK